jgi:5-methylcytosine-specific restriction endonuclease McrA
MNSLRTIDMPGLRSCLRPPIDEIAEATEYLDAAATAHLAKNSTLASDLIRRADVPAIRDWAYTIMGKNSEYNRYWLLDGSPAVVSVDLRKQPRMPSEAQKAELHLRDGHHCRFCGIPVIRKKVRVFLIQHYPDAAKWVPTNGSNHTALRVMDAQYDHILPHSRGGATDLHNLVVTCAPCNYGRWKYTIEEVRLTDPREREPVRSNWDGLERLLKHSE